MKLFYYSTLISLYTLEFASSSLSLRGSRSATNTVDNLHVSKQRKPSNLRRSINNGMKRQAQIQDKTLIMKDDRVSTLENKPLLIVKSDLFNNDSSTSLSEEEIDTYISETMTSATNTATFYELQSSLVPELHLFSYTQPQHGSLKKTTGGNLMYTPDKFFSGQDSFIYKATNGLGEFGDAIVHIFVEDVENDPIAHSDKFYLTGSDHSSVKITREDLWKNDEDPEQNGFIEIYIKKDPKHGKLILSEEGNSWNYIPKPGFSGRDTFRYSSVDALSKEDDALVEIFIGDTQQ